MYCKDNGEVYLERFENRKGRNVTTIENTKLNINTFQLTWKILKACLSSKLMQTFS